jgi:hypothetical protein
LMCSSGGAPKASATRKGRRVRQRRGIAETPDTYRVAG